MPFNKGLLTSNSDEWSTPRWLFDRLNSVFQFDTDCAATDHNNLCSYYFTKTYDGLTHSWKDCRCFCNPPYSKIATWAEKFTQESERASLIVALIPARVDTRWWQDYITKADLVHFIRGRLKFSNSKNSAPFPSALAFWFGLNKICIKPKTM